jgi:hypothetical protein
MAAAKRKAAEVSDVQPEPQQETPFDERRLTFLKLLAHGLTTGAVSPGAYARVKRLSVGDGDSEYRTVWSGVSAALQSQLSAMTHEDLLVFARRGKLHSFEDEQFQVNAPIILGSVKVE